MAKKFVPNNNDFAIAYYRFSPHAQSDASIQQQRDAAQKYAAGHGLQIVKEYKDEAISGTTDQRPGFQLMLSEIGKIKPGALIIWKTDRLGRDRYDLAIAKKYIRDDGCVIHYIAEPIAGDAPESALMEGVPESMAEYYSRQLRTNIKRGHLYNAQNCLYNGHKALGYAAEPAPEFGKDRQRYVIDPVTAPFVQKIFEDYAAGKPMVEIAKELNSLGVTTVRGKPFTVNSLAHILNNRAYIGEYRYGDIVTTDGMPAIVSPEVFEAAQKRLILNKRQGGQRANGLTPEEAPRFWLTGKLYCGKCGTPMQGCSGTSSHKGAKHYYYACGAARKKKCLLKYVKKDKIEAIACFMLSECLKDTELLASLAVDVAAYYQKEHEDKGDIEGLKTERAETEKALNNLVRAIEQGIFSETTQTRLLELESRKKALTEAIEAEEIKRAVTKNEISIQHFFDEYKNADLNDPTVRDYLLDYFVDKIFVYDDRVILTAWYGDDKKEITWGDIDCVVVKDRKRKKGSSASELVPPAQKFPPPFRFRLRRKLHSGGNFFAFRRDPLRWAHGGVGTRPLWIAFCPHNTNKKVRSFGFPKTADFSITVHNIPTR